MNRRLGKKKSGSGVLLPLSTSSAAEFPALTSRPDGPASGPCRIVPSSGGPVRSQSVPPPGRRSTRLQELSLSSSKPSGEVIVPSSQPDASPSPPENTVPAVHGSGNLPGITFLSETFGSTLTKLFDLISASTKLSQPTRLVLLGHLQTLGTEYSHLERRAANALDQQTRGLRVERGQAAASLDSLVDKVSVLQRSVNSLALLASPSPAARPAAWISQGRGAFQCVPRKTFGSEDFSRNTFGSEGVSRITSGSEQAGPEFYSTERNRHHLPTFGGKNFEFLMLYPKCRNSMQNGVEISSGPEELPSVEEEGSEEKSATTDVEEPPGIEDGEMQETTTTSTVEESHRVGGIGKNIGQLPPAVFQSMRNRLVRHLAQANLTGLSFGIRDFKLLRNRGIGFQVEPCSRVEEVIKVLEERVLTDRLFDGYELVRKTKKLPRLKFFDIPALLPNSSSEDEITDSTFKQSLILKNDCLQGVTILGLEDRQQFGFLDAEAKARIIAFKKNARTGCFYCVLIANEAFIKQASPLWKRRSAYVDGVSIGVAGSSPLKRCFKCQELGHVEANCPLKTKASSMRCGNCSALDHTTQDCRNNASHCWKCHDKGLTYNHRPNQRGCNLYEASAVQFLSSSSYGYNH